MSRRFIFLAIGSRGDVDPLKEVASELARRGQDVLIASLDAFAEEFRSLGLSTVTVPPALHFPLAPDRKERLGRAILARSVHDWIRGRDVFHARAQWVFDFIRDHHVRGKTVVVARSGLAGARMAREVFDIRLCTVHHSPASFRSRMDNYRFALRGGTTIVRQAAQDFVWRAADALVGLVLLKRLNAFRARLNLPPVRRLFDVWSYSPDLNLGLFPSWYSAPQLDWPTNAKTVGFPKPPARSDEDIPPAVSRFLSEGEPPVVISYGAHEDRGAKLEHVVAELTSRGFMRAIFLGREAPATPANERLLYCTFVPLHALLSHCKALIHHGGIGTMAAAFAAGTPQIVIPVVGDQWDQARRVVRLRCGELLKRRRLERQLPDAITRVASDARIYAACKDVEKKMAREQGMAGPTADLLEAMTGHRGTSPRSERDLPSMKSAFKASA